MAAAQDSWKIVHNGKVRLTATEESEGNRFAIKKSDLKTNGVLAIYIKENAPQKGWIRTVLAVDKNENELASGEGNLVKIANAKLAPLASKSGTKAGIIRLYTLSLPSDPAQAALVRVRRIHLATIQIK